MSPEQKSEYIEQKKYEADDRRAILHDKLGRWKQQCKVNGNIWVVKARMLSQRDRRKMDEDPYWFPRNVSILDFGCMSHDDLRYELQRAGYLL